MKVEKQDRQKVLMALGQEVGSYDIETEFNSEIILQIHDEMINKFGGIYGVRDEGLFESVCIDPYQSCFGEDLYPTVFDKAAKYLVDFARYQVFIDGNKRTGLETAIRFLEENGWTVELTNSEMYHLTMDIATGKHGDLSYVSEKLEYASVPRIEQENTIEEKDDSNSKDEVSGGKTVKTDSVYIKCPYSEKEEAKSFGARWDPTVRLWYISKDANPIVFEKWPIVDSKKANNFSESEEDFEREEEGPGLE